MSGEEFSEPPTVEPYSVLAAGYDVVMGHVDYGAWASYVHEIIERFHPEARRILELGCGTGSLAMALQPKGAYDYRATDQSMSMLKVARRKAFEEGVPIDFSQADFTDFEISRPVDVVILLYDGLNYLLEKRDVAVLFAHARAALEEGGLFVVDQSTPVNSESNERFFEDEGTVDGYTYVRRSWYNPETRRHTTRFDITVAGRTYREEHVQRAYTQSEILQVIEGTEFSVAGSFAGMTRQTATDTAERIHWVLRKP